jgi:hypothetical protein
MSEMRLEDVIEAQAGLIAALDGGRAEVIESATAALARALDAVRSTGAWRANPEDAERVGFALRQTEAARTRVNYLADGTRQRLERIVAGRRGGNGATYDKLGKARFSL